MDELEVLVVGVPVPAAVRVAVAVRVCLTRVEGSGVFLWVLKARAAVQIAGCHSPGVSFKSNRVALTTRSRANAQGLTRAGGGKAIGSDFLSCTGSFPAPSVRFQESPERSLQPPKLTADVDDVRDSSKVVRVLLLDVYVWDFVEEVRLSVVDGVKVLLSEVVWAVRLVEEDMRCSWMV